MCFSLTKFIYIYLTSLQYSYFWLTSSNAIICNAAIFSIIFHLYPCNQQLAANSSVVLNNFCSGVRLYSMWGIVLHPMDAWPWKTISSAGENGIGTDGDTLVLWTLNNLRYLAIWKITLKLLSECIWLCKLFYLRAFSTLVPRNSY